MYIGIDKPCKGETICFAPSELIVPAPNAQGVALGWTVRAFQATHAQGAGLTGGLEVVVTEH